MSVQAQVNSSEVSRTWVGTASLIGTTIEFYDFYIFGIASALVFNKVFFPSLDPVTGTIAAFATFGVGFISRPLGAIIFGHFGDRIGRKVTLIASLLTMGISTVLIGLLPTYATIGIWAPIALSSLRFIQGIGLGGEWGGAALLATEYAPKNKRGLFGSLPQLGSAPGLLLSNGAFLLLNLLLPAEDFLSWGWRVPFVASIILVLFGLYVRLSIAETPIFQKVLAHQATLKAPIFDVLKSQFLPVVLGGLSTAITYVLFYMTSIFGLTYGVATLGFPRSHMLMLSMIAVVAMGASTVIAGMLGDKYGRPRMIVISGCVAIVWAFCFFPLMDTKNSVIIAIAMSISLTIMSGIYGPMGAFLPELFKPSMRYTGAALAYSLGGIFGGAFAPMIAADIAAKYGSHSIGFYTAIMAFLSIISVLILRRRMPASFGDESVSAPASSNSASPDVAQLRPEGAT